MGSPLLDGGIQGVAPCLRIVMACRFFRGSLIRFIRQFAQVSASSLQDGHAQDAFDGAGNLRADFALIDEKLLVLLKQFAVEKEEPRNLRREDLEQRPIALLRTED